MTNDDKLARPNKKTGILNFLIVGAVLSVAILVAGVFLSG